MKRFQCLCTMLVIATVCACDSTKPKEPAVEKPKVTERELTAEKKFSYAKECAIAGKKYFDDKAKESERPDLLFVSWLKDDEYHYNARLNTCLIFYTLTVIQQNGKTLGPNAFVIDIFSNKTLLNMKMDKLSPENFAAQKEALFNE